jgi:hypothetical protein
MSDATAGKDVLRVVKLNAEDPARGPAEKNSAASLSN